jgi:hypothetical protein
MRLEGHRAASWRDEPRHASHRTGQTAGRV